MSGTSVVALVAGAALGFAGAAGAATIAPTGVTTVEVTAPLGDLGLGAAPTGTATVDATGPDPAFAFPITGGTATESALTILHDGSGVELFASADATISATVGNFVIDTATDTVSGDVNGAPGGVLFDFGTVSEAGIELTVATLLSDSLTAVFGAPSLEGATFGIATTEAAVVPIPAALPLLAGGLAILGMIGRRRRPV